MTGAGEHRGGIILLLPPLLMLSVRRKHLLNGLFWACGVLAATAVHAQTPTPTPWSAAAIGDCNNDGRVTVDELILGINVVLGIAHVSACPSIDSCDPPHLSIHISCLIYAVRNALTAPPDPCAPGCASCTSSPDEPCPEFPSWTLNPHGDPVPIGQETAEDRLWQCAVEGCWADDATIAHCVSRYVAGDYPGVNCIAGCPLLFPECMP